MEINIFKKKAAHARTKVREATATYIASGLGIVVGLSWNDAIRSAIEYFYPPATGASLLPKFFYAFVLTVIVVFVTAYIIRPPTKDSTHTPTPKPKNSEKAA